MSRRVPRFPRMGHRRGNRETLEQLHDRGPALHPSPKVLRLYPRLLGLPFGESQGEESHGPRRLEWKVMGKWG